MRSEGSKSAPARMGQLDICRGIAILAVLFIHVSGHFLPIQHPAKSHAPLSWAWYALAVPNVDFQWAVPCFLMLSALVNALSLGRSGDVGSYAKRRAQTALLPYVLWSGVYIAVNYALGHLHDLSPVHVVKMLLAGTAHFHLYFFVLVLELYVLLPLLVPLFQRRPPFWLVAILAIALQGVIYVLNRYVLLHRFQSTILWDVLPVALGLWLFSQAGRMEDIRSRGRWGAGVVTLIALTVYCPLAVATILPHAHINTALYQIGQWGYTAGMSFLVLALGWALGRNWLTTVLAYLGAELLAIYVMHPLAIIALDLLKLNKPRHFALTRLHLHMQIGVGGELAVYYAACLTLPLLAAWVWRQGKKVAAG